MFFAVFSSYYDFRFVIIFNIFLFVCLMMKIKVKIIIIRCSCEIVIKDYNLAFPFAYILFKLILIKTVEYSLIKILTFFFSFLKSKQVPRSCFDICVKSEIFTRFVYLIICVLYFKIKILSYDVIFIHQKD